MPTFKVKNNPKKRKHLVITIKEEAPARQRRITTSARKIKAAKPVPPKPSKLKERKVITLTVAQLKAKPKFKITAPVVKPKPEKDFSKLKPIILPPPRAVKVLRKPEPAPPHSSVVVKPNKRVVEIVDAPPSISYKPAPEGTKVPPIKVGDGVKLGIMNYEQFAENLMVQVTAIKGKRILGHIRDTIFWTSNHGLKCGSRVEFEKHNVLRHVPQPKWVEDRYYEQRKKDTDEVSS